MASPTHLQKAFILSEKGTRIDCMFNPEKFSFSAVNKWIPERTKAQSVPRMAFGGHGQGSFSLSLVFDTTSTGAAVTTHTNKLLALMEIDKSLADYNSKVANGRPPWVTFNWGQYLHTFKAIIDSLSVTFTYFSAEGTPLRANAEVGLKQYEPDPNWAKQNPTSGTPLPQRTHLVGPGDTLDRIAAQYYNDSTKWRLIAAANGITDPLAIRPGSIISVPDRTETT